MKSKRLTVLLLILCFVVLLVVLSSTVFTLQSVSLNWLTTRSLLAEEDLDSLTTNVSVPIGESVFLFRKSTLKEELEKHNPYLQVVSIETVFPNRAVVHVAERRQLYAIKISQDNYVILDKYLKILNISSADDLFSISEGNRPAIVEIEDSNINITIGENKTIRVEISSGGMIEETIQFAIGDFLDIQNIDDSLKSLTESLLEANYKDQSIRGFISKISLNLNSNEEINIKTRCGIDICLKGCNEDLTTKLLTGIGAYEKLRNEPYFATTGTISVFKSLVDSKIYAVHSY